MVYRENCAVWDYEREVVVEQVQISGGVHDADEGDTEVVTAMGPFTQKAVRLSEDVA